MAPEQFGERDEVGPWTDLYAVGVILYEILHGRTPYDGTLSELVAQKVGGQLPPRAFRPGWVEEPRLMALVERLLRTHPRRRPRFAREVRDELLAITDWLDEPTEWLGEASESEPPAHAPTLLQSASLSGHDVPAEPTAEDALELPHRVHAAEVLGRGLFHLRGIPLVARGAEQSQLRALMGAVCGARQLRVLVITGPAGSGKSTLAKWGLAEAERTAAMEGLAAGYDLSGGGMTGGLQNVLHRLLDDPFASSEPEVEPWGWLGDGEAAFDVDHARQWMAADRGVASMADLELLRDVLLTASRRRPLYLWLDDVGWSRDGAFDLVEMLLARGDAPILAVLTLRSGTAGHPWVAARLATLQERAAVARLEVKPLSPVGRVELLEQVVPLVADLSAALTGRLHGNPRRLLERAKAWVEGGGLRPGPLGWDCAPGVTLERLLEVGAEDEVVARRLAAVSGETSPLADEVLLRAALLGFSFEEELLLGSFSPHERQTVRAVLGRALLEGVLAFDQIGRVHRFESEAIHRYLIDRVGGDGRAQMSARRLAQTLEAGFGEGRVGVGARTAYLYRLAGNRPTSYTVLREAVAQLGRLGLSDRAGELAAVARAWRQADGELSPAEQTDVVLAEAFHHYYALRYPQALVLVQDAKRILARAEEPEREAIAFNLEMTTHYYANRLGTAARMAEDIDSPLEGAIAPGLLRSAIVGHLMRSELLGLAGRHDEALAQTRWGLERFALSPVVGHRIAIWLVHCEQLVAAGRLEEADALSYQLRHELEPSKAVRRGEVIDLCTRVDAFMGRWSEVKPRFEARLGVAERHGDPWRATAHRVYLAWYAALHERDSEVRSAVEAMLTAYASAPQEEAMTTLALSHLAGALDRRGATDLATRVQRIVDERHEAIRRGFER